MSMRGGGGRRGGGDFQNRGGGRGGGGRGRGRGRGGGEQQPVAPRPRRDPPIGDLATAPAIARGDLSSSSVSPSPQMMTGEMEKLTIGGQAAVAERPMEPLAVTATVEGARPAPAPVSSKAITVPRRPGYGTRGVKCIVRANHFLVEVASRDLVHYDVAIVPEVTSRTVCRNIVSQLVASYKESHLGRLTPVYDGRKSLYTAGELPFKSKKFKIELTDRDRLKEYNVNIQLAGRADLHHLQQFLQGQQSDVPQDTIQVLDIVLRESPSRNYVTVGRSFFSPEFGNLKDIGNGLECWRGYYQSLRPTQMGLSLNIDISATSFYKSVSVVEFIAEYFNLQQRDISRPLTEKQRVEIKKALRGIRVEVTHRKDFNRRYKIAGISAENLSQLTFVEDSGARKHVMDYFKDKYNCQLKHGNWPCLQSGNDAKPTYLPMEICKIVGGQRFSKKLNKKQVTEILRSMCHRPNQREESIMEMFRHNAYNKDKHAGEFGINLMERLASVEARVLPPPMLKYHDSGKEKTCSPRVGAWSMTNKRMVNGGSIQSWACISFSWKLRSEAVYKFCESLFRTCNNIGMAVNPNPVIEVLFGNPDNVEGAVREAYDQVSDIKGKKQPLELLLIVLPDDIKGSHDMLAVKGSHGKIKRVCETELGIVSQCCLPTHVYECKLQYMENVALKINVKVGGRNTVLVDAISRQIPLVSDKPTIIFGADVTHPAPGDDSLSSIAAVVASVDWPEVTKYRALVSSQQHREEIIQDLYIPNAKDNNPGGMIRELLLAFYRSARQKPHRIIFYRDGVSEGQFSQVLLYEMDAIRKACQSLEKDYAPPVTFVVVQKRHHTRLFPDERSNQIDRSGNIMPGTVVDRKICHPTEFDFYLCSHAGIQGTSRPTHYHVLFDENNFTADGLQSLTNNLCYTYARCTRSVSIVPPAYYAHLAAFRAREYVEGDSEGASSAGGDTRARTTEVRPLPGIKDNVKEVMFYC